MKKLFSVLVIILSAAGCHKQQNLQKDLTGTWHVYKYILHNADETQQFQQQYGNYTITFTGSTFTRTVTSPDTVAINGSYQFADNNEQLLLNYTSSAVIDSVNVTTTNQEQYTLFDVTSVSMELFTDSSILYLDKNQ